MNFADAIEIAKINPELKSAVFDSMPNCVNKFEQVLYVYTKLCSILNYDPQFWVSNLDNGPRGDYHHNIDNIDKVSPDNPNVVCYSFSLIFAKFLDDLDVDYRVKSVDELVRYTLHADIIVSFKPKDVVILPDEVAFLSENNFVKMRNGKADVYFAGYNDMNDFKTAGLVTPYLVERDEFGEPLDEDFDNYLCESIIKISDIVREERDAKVDYNKQLIEAKEKIEELEKKYGETFGINEKLTQKEKLDIMLKQMATSSVDEYSSCFFRKNIFRNITKDMDTSKIYTFAIMREKVDGCTDLYNMISMLNICDDSEDVYIKFSANNTVNVYNHNDIQKGFDQGKYDYIDHGNMLPPNCILPKIKSASVDRLYGDKLKRLKIKEKRIGEYMENSRLYPKQYPSYPQLDVYKIYTTNENIDTNTLMPTGLQR